MVRSAVHRLPVVSLDIVAWLFVQRLNQVTRGPLHEHYENRTTTQQATEVLRLQLRTQKTELVAVTFLFRSIHKASTLSSEPIGP